MVDYTVVVLGGAFSSGVTATLDILQTGRRLATGLGVAAPVWRVCSLTAGQVELGHGLRLGVDPLPPPQEHDRSTWVVVGMGADTVEAVRGRLEDADATLLTERLARHVEGGGRVAAGCASVFLLVGAGLLAGRRATTTWWLASYLQSLEPECTVQSERMVCADRGVTTAGAAFAQTDLMLHLLRESHGRDLTTAVSRSLLLDARQAQAPYVVPEVLADCNELVAQFIEAVERDLATAVRLPAIAAELGISERTLARRVKNATGLTPLELATMVRARHACHLLSTTTMTVDQVAMAVGYRDPTALRKMIRRTLGASPSALRD